MNFDVKLRGLFTLAGARNKMTQANQTDWKNVTVVSKRFRFLFFRWKFSETHRVVYENEANRREFATMTLKSVDHRSISEHF